MPLNGPGSVCGRVVPLIPDVTRLNDLLASRTAHTLEEISDALEQVRDSLLLGPTGGPAHFTSLSVAVTLQARKLKEEGIVVKALDSSWEPNDRRWGRAAAW